MASSSGNPLLEPGGGVSGWTLCEDCPGWAWPHGPVAVVPAAVALLAHQVLEHPVRRVAGMPVRPAVKELAGRLAGWGADLRAVELAGREWRVWYDHQSRPDAA